MRLRLTLPASMSDGHFVRSLLRAVPLEERSHSSMARRGTLGMLGVLAQGGVRFLTNILVGRLGGPAVLATVASAASTAQLLSLVGPTTTGSAAAKFLAQARGRAESGEIAAVAAHLAHRTVQTAVALAAVAAPLWVLVDGGGWAEGLCVSLLVLAYSGYSFTRGLQFGAGQVQRAATYDVLTGTLALAGILAALLAGVRGIYVLLPLAAAYLLFTVANWPWSASGRPIVSLRREMDSFVGLGVIGTLASAGFLQLSMIIARLGDDAISAGYYAAAMTLATPPSLISVSLSLVLFPALAESLGRGDQAGFRRRVDISSRFLIAVVFPFFGILILCSDLIVHVIWGNRFDGAAELLPIMFSAVMVNTLGVPSVNSLTTRSQLGMKLSTGSTLFGMLCGIATWVAVTPALGVLGVTIGYFCGSVVIVAIPVASVWRRDQQPWGRLALRLVCGCTALLVLYLAEREVGASPWSDLLFAALFAAAWSALMRKDIRIALRTIYRRRVT